MEQGWQHRLAIPSGHGREPSGCRRLRRYPGAAATFDTAAAAAAAAATATAATAPSPPFSFVESFPEISNGKLVVVHFVYSVEKSLG